MNHRLREFLINTIRSGIIFEPAKRLKIIPATNEQNIQSYYVYQEAYDEALSNEIMTVDDAEKWMRATGLWQKRDDESLEQINKDIEDAKVNLYNNRNNSDLKKRGKTLIKNLEYVLSQQLNKKNAFYNQTCEAIAELERLTWVLKQTCYIDDNIIDNDYDIDNIINIYNKSFLSDSEIRDLARNEPWRSIWIIGKSGKLKLFFNRDDQDVTFNQKNLLLWSQTYDNIQESIEAPTEDVIEDDYLLDGWFIIQRRKRKRDLKEKELNDNLKNEKIKSAKELFIIPREGQKHSSIYELNSPESAFKIKQRSQAIKNSTTISYDQLPDIQNEGRQQAMQNWKSHAKGRK
jgi:hypothetical protein